jgi:hypothetical protein
VRPDETGAPDDEYRLCQFNPRCEPENAQQRCKVPCRRRNTKTGRKEV